MCASALLDCTTNRNIEFHARRLDVLESGREIGSLPLSFSATCDMVSLLSHVLKVSQDCDSGTQV